MDELALDTDVVLVQRHSNGRERPDYIDENTLFLAEDRYLPLGGRSKRARLATVISPSGKTTRRDNERSRLEMHFFARAIP